MQTNQQSFGQKAKKRGQNRTQSRDKKTSADPMKNLMTQVQKGNASPTMPSNIDFQNFYQPKHQVEAIREGEGLLPVRRAEKSGKKTLVLDLDETLVHSAFKPPGEVDIILPIDLEGKTCHVYVLVRPGCKQFLKEMADYYEVIIFTASLSKYAEPLMRILDEEGVFCDHLLFREHCTYHNNSFVKDLTRIGRDMKDVIIVDNSPMSYQFQPENALPSINWYEDKSDT